MPHRWYRRPEVPSRLDRESRCDSERRSQKLSDHEGEEAELVALSGVDGCGARRNSGGQQSHLPANECQQKQLTATLGVSVSSRQVPQPKRPKPSEESPTGVSDAKEPTVGKTKEHGAQARPPEPTQGHDKALQRLKDLFQNEEFTTALAAILRPGDLGRRKKQLFEFAELHNLDLSFEPLFLQLIVEAGLYPHPGDAYPYAEGVHPDSESLFAQGAVLDFCQTIDEAGQVLKDPERCYYSPVPRPHADKRLSITLYPIHLCISPMATQRDVLAYVAKNWNEIRSLLDSYHRAPPTIRKRREDARDQFIWEHRTVPSKELADMVRHEFPGESLEYFEIDNIKYYLRKRHSRI